MEQYLINKFIEYLKKEKSYPDDCFLKDVHIVDSVGKGRAKKIICDLVILDTSNNNYLALIEFKNEVKDLNEYKMFLYQSYIKVLNIPLLPCYFISATDEDFVIYSLNGYEISEINIKDFPNYITLKSKVLADRKTAMESEMIKQNQENRKRKAIWSTSMIGAIISAIIGIIISVFTFNDRSNIDPSRMKTEYMIKSLEEEIKKQHLILDTLSSQIIRNSNILIDSATYQKYILSHKELENLNIRVLAMELLIDQNPKNLMQLQDLNHKIQNLNTLLENSEKNYEIKLANLESKHNIYLMIIFPLILTIIGAFTTFAIASLKK